MITNYFDPALPPGCQRQGRIYEADDPRELSEDMLDVVLPGGAMISVGWYGRDGGHPGAYGVDVTQGLKELRPPADFLSAAEASAYVEKLARELCKVLPSPVLSSRTTDSPGSGVCRAFSPES